VRLVAYVRLSPEKRARPATQEADLLRAWAEREGHLLVAVTYDEDIRGRRLRERPGLYHALALIADRRAAGLLIERVETLGSTAPVQEAVLALVWWYGGRVISRQVNDALARDPARRQLRELASAILQMERGVAASRSQARRRRALARGSHAGGAPPFGYRAESGRLTADRREQAILDRIAELRRTGASLREIGRTLDQEGHRPKRSERWHPESLRRLLVRMEATRPADPENS
jgi:DNA invertase Pin-like site-specific DNA recombinase